MGDGVTEMGTGVSCKQSGFCSAKRAPDAYNRLSEEPEDRSGLEDHSSHTMDQTVDQWEGRCVCVCVGGEGRGGEGVYDMRGGLGKV